MKKTLLFAFTGLLLAGCAHMHEMMGGKRMKGCTGVCDVVVTVTAPCTVQVPVPDPVHVAPGTHVIKWTMSSSTPSQFRFAPNGIAFQAGAPMSPAPGGGPRVFVLSDNNSSPGNYKYTINVTDGTRTCNLDPTVINDQDSYY